MKPALVATATVLVLTAGCGGGGDKTAVTTLMTTNPTATAAGTMPGRFHYSRALEKSYMRACTRSGTVKETVCACTLDKLSASVSTRDFGRMSLSGVIPPRIRQAIRQAASDCRNA